MPLPKNPPPLSAFGRSVLAPMKNPGSGNALEFCGHFGGHLDHDADPGIFKAFFLQNCGIGAISCLGGRLRFLSTSSFSCNGFLIFCLFVLR